MATTRVHTVINALVTTFSAASGLSGVTVVDGPIQDFTQDKDLVFVGHDGGEDDSAGTGSSATQEWVGVGTNSRRDERVEVTCAVIARTGDADMALRRARAYTLLDACEVAILADHTLGVGTPGTPGAARNALITSSELHQANNAVGTIARVVFTVSCICRL